MFVFLFFYLSNEHSRSIYYISSTKIRKKPPVLFWSLKQEERQSLNILTISKKFIPKDMQSHPMKACGLGHHGPTEQAMGGNGILAATECLLSTILAKPWSLLDSSMVSQVSFFCRTTQLLSKRGMWNSKQRWKTTDQNPDCMSLLRL